MENIIAYGLLFFVFVVILYTLKLPDLGQNK